jgi:hypothetical protein
MLYIEIIAVCSQIHTEHINTLCGQNVEFCFSFLHQVVYSLVITGSCRINCLLLWWSRNGLTYTVDAVTETYILYRGIKQRPTATKFMALKSK